LSTLLLNSVISDTYSKFLDQSVLQKSHVIY